MVYAVLSKTLKYWDSGHNCARSVACGLLDNNKLELESELFNKALIPFGGGVGEGSICGAVTGSLIAISFILGEKEKSEERIKELTNRFKEEFKVQFSTLICARLLDEFRDINGEINHENEERREKCTNIVKTASTIAQAIIESTEFK